MKIFSKRLMGSNPQDGYFLPTIIAFIVAALMLVSAVVVVINTNLSLVGDNAQSQEAFNISEAGINYYLWHLSHNPTDYKDGGSTPATPDPTLGYGPYVHNYIDSQGINEGTYTLWINPQGTGSTLVNVRSIGQVAGSKSIRTIQAQIGAASFASYGVVSDSALWFGSDETADGPVFSNQGVRMDGPNTSVVESANSTYTPSYSEGGCSRGNCSEPGVWCNTSVTSPNCNTRDKSNWIFPSPQVDFNQVSSSLCTLKKDAFASDSQTSSLANQSNACSQTPTTRTNAYIPQYSSNGSYSTTRGYLMILNNNGTYDLYKVNSENDRATSYTSALSLTSVATGVSIPSSGVVFVEDNVWVMSSPGSNFDGRVTIASGRLASSTYSTNMVIAGNILYKNKDGSDALGLIAQNSIYIAPYAPPSSGSFNFEIDGALLAESGNVMYGELYSPYYGSVYRTSTNNCTRGWVNSNQTFTFYGSVATRQLWTWNFEGGRCGDAVYDSTSGYYISGIEHTTSSYDDNLEYAPPPSYPVTGSYNILSWREVLTQP